MTDAEKELIAASLEMRDSWSRRSSTAERFQKAKEAVAMERLQSEFPDWEAEFARLLHASMRAEKTYQQLASRVEDAGINLLNLVRKHAHDD